MRRCLAEKELTLSLLSRALPFELLKPRGRVRPREVFVELARSLGVGSLEQVAVAVRHVHGAMPDEVANRLQRDTGVVHQRNERMPAFVQADGDEWLRRLLSALFRFLCPLRVLGLPRLGSGPTNVTRSERTIGGWSKHEVAPLAAAPRLQLA